MKWDKFRDISTGNEKETLEFIFVHMDTEYRCEGGVYQEYNPGNFEKILKTLKMNEEIIGIYGVEEEKRDSIEDAIKEAMTCYITDYFKLSWITEDAGRI